MSAVAKSPAAYEHVDPAAVGNAQRVLVSELSGRANIWSSLRKAGFVEDAAGEARWQGVAMRACLDELRDGYEQAKEVRGLFHLHFGR